MKISYDKHNRHLTATEKAAIKRCWEFYNSPAFFDLKSDYMIFKKKLCLARNSYFRTGA